MSEARVRANRENGKKGGRRQPGATSAWPFLSKVQRANALTVARPNLDRIQEWERDPAALPKRPPGRV